jgi:hypothetical protein
VVLLYPAFIGGARCLCLYYPYVPVGECFKHSAANLWPTITRIGAGKDV